MSVFEYERRFRMQERHDAEIERGIAALLSPPKMAPSILEAQADILEEIAGQLRVLAKMQRSEERAA